MLTYHSTGFLRFQPYNAQSCPPSLIAHHGWMQKCHSNSSFVWMKVNWDEMEVNLEWNMIVFIEFWIWNKKIKNRLPNLPWNTPIVVRCPPSLIPSSPRQHCFPSGPSPIMSALTITFYVFEKYSYSLRLQSVWTLGSTQILINKGKSKRDGEKW